MIVATILFLLQVYVIGEEGILEELQLAGFTGLGGPVIYLFFPNKVYELIYKTHHLYIYIYIFIFNCIISLHFYLP